MKIKKNLFLFIVIIGCIIISVLAIYKISKNNYTTTEICLIKHYVFQGDISRLDHELTSYNLSAKDNGGRTIIFYAQDLKTLNFLLSKGADLNVCDNEGVSVLQFFCMQRQNLLVKKIITEVQNINTQDNIGGSPLLWSIVTGNEELVKLLLEKGANTKQLFEGKTMLEIAKKNKNADEAIIRLLDDCESKK